jgi:hypothetical protein
LENVRSAMEKLSLRVVNMQSLVIIIRSIGKMVLVLALEVLVKCL